MSYQIEKWKVCTFSCFERFNGSGKYVTEQELEYKLGRFQKGGMVGNGILATRTDQHQGLSTMLRSAYMKVSPWLKKARKRSPPWWSKDIVENIKEVRSFKSKHKKRNYSFFSEKDINVPLVFPFCLSKTKTSFTTIILPYFSLKY